MKANEQVAWNKIAERLPVGMHKHLTVRESQPSEFPDGFYDWWKDKDGWDEAYVMVLMDGDSAEPDWTTGTRGHLVFLKDGEVFHRSDETLFWYAYAWKNRECQSTCSEPVTANG